MGNARNFAFWVVLFLMILALFNLFSDGSGTMNSRQISYSDFIERVQNDQVSAVTIDGEERFHRGVIAGSADLAHGSDEVVTVQGVHEFP